MTFNIPIYKKKEEKLANEFKILTNLIYIVRVYQIHRCESKTSHDDFTSKYLHKNCTIWTLNS